MIFLRNISVVVIVLIFPVFIMAQSKGHRCAAMEYLAMQKSKDPSIEMKMDSVERFTKSYIATSFSNNSKTVITIPVVVHVLYSLNWQNISDAQIQSQIDVLNEDYRRLNSDTINTPSLFKGVAADCQIEFCLAKRDPQGNPTTGITRTHTNKAVFDMQTDDAKYTSTGGHDIWDRNNYLNLWVVPSITDGSTSNILGYAQFPGGGSSATDGVVICYKNFGRIGNLNPYYNKGRTATHEIGHWLNLLHIWGDDGGQCWGSDQVGDTPNQADETTGCPTFPQPSCGNTSDMFSNYLDYTDDACMNIFTNGQKARMWATLNGFRKSLFSSNGCIPVGFAGTTPDLNLVINPNPTNGIVKISFSKPFYGRILVANGTGQTVLSESLKGAKEYSLDIGNQPQGVYFVAVMNDKSIVYRKIQLIK